MSTPPQNTKAAHLSIIDEIDWEDEDPDAAVDKVQKFNVDAHEGEDCHEESKEDEDKEDAEEDPAAHCEINLGLKTVHILTCSRWDVIYIIYEKCQKKTGKIKWEEFGLVRENLESKEGEGDDEERSGGHGDHHHLPLVHHCRLKASSIIMFVGNIFTVAFFSYLKEITPTCPTITDSAAVKRASRMKLIGKVLQTKTRKFT